MNPYTRDNWRNILRGCWGNGHTLHSEAVKQIEAVAMPGETALDTCARMAEVDIRGVSPFDHWAILHRVARAEVTRDT